MCWVRERELLDTIPGMNKHNISENGIVAAPMTPSRRPVTVSTPLAYEEKLERYECARWGRISHETEWIEWLQTIRRSFLMGECNSRFGIFRIGDRSGNKQTRLVVEFDLNRVLFLHVSLIYICLFISHSLPFSFLHHNSLRNGRLLPEMKNNLV